MKKSLVVLTTYFLVSCTNVKPLTESNLIPSTMALKPLANLLYKQAAKCWERPGGMFGDGVELDTRINQKGFIIEASRYAPDIGLGRKPFAEIILNKRNNQTVVKVVEQGFNPVSEDVSITPEVKQWITGNYDCITNKHKKTLF